MTGVQTCALPISAGTSIEAASSVPLPTAGPPRMPSGLPYPEAKLAPSGKPPSYFIDHFTGDRHSPQLTADIWRKERPGVGTQYIMDREGNVHDVEREFKYTGTIGMNEPSTPKKGPFANLKNRDLVQMEYTATSESDLTPAMIESSKKFAASRYPDTLHAGHGQVNPPPHRDKDEGMTISSLINEQRALERGASATGPGTILGGPPESAQQPVQPTPAASSQPSPQTPVPGSPGSQQVNINIRDHPTTADQSRHIDAARSTERQQQQRKRKRPAPEQQHQPTSRKQSQNSGRVFSQVGMLTTVGAGGGFG